MRLVRLFAIVFAAMLLFTGHAEGLMDTEEFLIYYEVISEHHTHAPVLEEDAMQTYAADSGYTGNYWELPLGFTFAVVTDSAGVPTGAICIGSETMLGDFLSCSVTAIASLDQCPTDLSEIRSELLRAYFDCRADSQIHTGQTPDGRIIFSIQPQDNGRLDMTAFLNPGE